MQCIICQGDEWISVSLSSVSVYLVHFGFVVNGCNYFTDVLITIRLYCANIDDHKRLYI